MEPVQAPEHPLETESRRLQATLNRLITQFRHLREQEFPKFRAWQERHRKELEGVQRAISRVEDQLKTVLAHPLAESLIAGAQALPGRSVIQWPRKIMHSTLGLTAAWLFGFSPYPRAGVVTFATFFTLAVIGIEVGRLKNVALNNWLVKNCRTLMREEEKQRPTSALYYTLSMYLVAILFPLPVTLLTCLFIALGDTAASLVGVTWGKTLIAANSSVEGSLACFAVCFVCALFIRSLMPTFPGPVIPFALLAGIIGAVAEASFPKWDDNLVIPLVSAPALWLLIQLF